MDEMDDLEKELKEDFLEEAQQLLDDIEQAFLRLENEKNDPELLNEIFRFAHNLKGTSRAVGFGGMAEFTHEVENLILKLKNGELQVTDSIVSLLLECNDHIGLIVKILSMDLNSTVDNSELISKVIAAVNGELTETSTSETPAPEVVVEPTIESSAPVESIPDPSSNLFEESDENIKGMEILVGQQVVSKHAVEEKSVEEVTPKVETAPIPEPVKAQEPAPAPAKKPKLAAPKKQEASKSNKDESIRVDLSKVELLNNYVGELVILQTVLNQRGQTHVHDELMKKSLHQLGKLSKEIQDISMSLRMIPLKTTMGKMTRIVRDTSKSLNKTVNLHLIGEDTEIDKTVLEHLADPLVHIVRNAVDHGLESTEGRIEAGKEEAGNVSIKAYHEGNNLVLEVFDDGKGIDPEIIRAKAIEKDIISENTSMSDLEIINLIFHPGFSTKEEVTEVSGRGVGMDVVKTNIEKLSGQVIVTSELNKGSVFKIQLPLTLAIIEGMIINVSEERFIIPFIQVSEFLKPNKEDFHFVSGIGECLDLRGEVLPVLFVEEAIKREIKNNNINEKTAIIVKSGATQYAVMVDDIVNQQQVVIKKLGIEIEDQIGYVGSAILGDGKPAIILDLVELFRDHKKISHRTHRTIERTI